MRAKAIIFCLAFLGLAAAAPAAWAQDASLPVTLDPPEIKIGAFFDGGQLRVSGRIPRGDQAVVMLASPPEEQTFRIKSRVGGVLWMNRGEVTFRNLPRVYLVESSTSKEVFASQDAAVGLGGLASRAAVEGGDASKAESLAEFIKIKKAEGLYAVKPGTVELRDADGGGQAFNCSFDLPAKVPHGEYLVQAMALSPDGKVQARGEQKLAVKEEGFPAFLSSLAFNYSLLYGVMAVLVALVGGLVTSMLFRGGGGAH